MSKMSWKIIDMSISEFLNTWHPNIDCNPVHQRISVENIGVELPNRKEASKRQSIIDAILDGVDISELKINERTPEERQNYIHPYESIDGGHRKRAIHGFKNGDFALNAYLSKDIGYKKFSQLSLEQQQDFLDHPIRLVVYKHLTPSQKAKQFRTTNNSTPVNDQEMLNGFGNIPIANAVRETARYIGEDIANTHHEIFTIKTDKKNKVIGQYLSFDPSRLSYDRLVARLFRVTIYGGERPVPCDDVQLNDMYEDQNIDLETADAAKLKVAKCLDFIMQVGNAKRNKLKGNAKITMDEFVTLYRLYYTYKSRWGDIKTGYKIQNWDKFYTLFAQSFKQFDKKNPTQFGLETINGGKSVMLRADAFNKNNRMHGSLRNWTENISWLETNFMDPEELIRDGVIVRLAGKRTFTKAERETAIIQQGFVDPIDGTPLDLENSHGGHKVAHALGGSSDAATNLVVLTKKNNLMQGTEDYEEFKERMVNRKIAKT